MKKIRTRVRAGVKTTQIPLDEKLDSIVKIAEKDDNMDLAEVLEDKFPNTVFNPHVKREVLLGLLLKMSLRNMSSEKIAEILNLTPRQVYAYRQVLKKRMSEEVTKISVAECVSNSFAVHKEIRAMAFIIATKENTNNTDKIAALRLASTQQLAMLKTLHVAGFFSSGKFSPSKSEFDNDTKVGNLESLLLSMSTDYIEDDIAEGVDLDADGEDYIDNSDEHDFASSKDITIFRV